MGWSYQKPQNYSQKRDEQAVSRWRAAIWPSKKAPVETDS